MWISQIQQRSYSSHCFSMGMCAMFPCTPLRLWYAEKQIGEWIIQKITGWFIHVNFGHSLSPTTTWRRCGRNLSVLNLGVKIIQDRNGKSSKWDRSDFLMNLKTKVWENPLITSLHISYISAQLEYQCMKLTWTLSNNPITTLFWEHFRHWCIPTEVLVKYWIASKKPSPYHVLVLRWEC